MLKENKQKDHQNIIKIDSNHMKRDSPSLKSEKMPFEYNI